MLAPNIKTHPTKIMSALREREREYMYRVCVHTHTLLHFMWLQPSIFSMAVLSKKIIMQSVNNDSSLAVGAWFAV